MPAGDHAAFKKMFGGAVYQIGCRAGTVAGTTPDTFVKNVLQP